MLNFEKRVKKKGNKKKKEIKMSPGSSISLLDLKSSMKDTKTLLGAKWHVTACISALIPPKEYIGFGLA